MKQSEKLLILFFYLFVIGLGVEGRRLGHVLECLKNIQVAGVTDVSLKAQSLGQLAGKRFAVWKSARSTPWGKGTVLELGKKQAMGKMRLDDSEKGRTLRASWNG